MPSSINASTTAGLVNTADTSGVLQLQTAGVTAISIDASQAVSFTNSPTVTGGTANGVAYLNGSKVLTTGSALTWDGSVLATSLSGGTGLSMISSASQAYINLRSVAIAGYEPFIGFGDASAGNIGQMIGINGGGLRWTTGGTERMRLDASGNLGIGTTSPSTYSKFAVINTDYSFGTFVTTNGTPVGINIGSNSVTQAAYLGTTTNHPLVINTNNAEKARIDTSGNLLVGTASTPTATCKFAVYGSGNLYTSALNSGTYTWFTGTNNNYYNFYDGGGTLKGYLTNSGTFTNTSDLAYKKDITGIQYGLADVLKMRSVFYRTKDYDEPQIGFIAQEMELIIPEVVSGEEGSKGIAYGNINAVLVKAIQEQQALITQLQADVALLKGA